MPTGPDEWIMLIPPKPSSERMMWSTYVSATPIVAIEMNRIAVPLSRSSPVHVTATAATAIPSVSETAWNTSPSAFPPRRSAINSEIAPRKTPSISA